MPESPVTPESPLTPVAIEERRFRWSAAGMAVVAIVGFFALLLLDQRLYHLFRVEDKAALERHSLYQLFRQVGYWPTWIAIGMAVGFHDAWRRAKRPPDVRPVERTLPLLIGPGTAGLAAELLKIVLRRERPDELGLAHFRPWSVDTFSGSGLGMPSSHAAVAFGAAFAVARVFPGAVPVVFVLALGCGVTRLLAGAHFATDVYVAAVVAYGLVSLQSRLWPGRGSRGP